MPASTVAPVGDNFALDPCDLTRRLVIELAQRILESTLHQVNKAVEQLDMPRSTAYEYIASGQLPTIKIGARRYVRATDLEQFIQSVAVPGVA